MTKAIYCNHNEFKLNKRKPELLLDIPEHVIEKACAAYWNTGVWPGQVQWEDLVYQADHRVPSIRLRIHAALSAALTAGLCSATHDQGEK